MMSSLRVRCRARLFCEAQLMMSLRHRNVLRIFGICADSGDLILALERASSECSRGRTPPPRPDGSLLSYLTKQRTSARLKTRFCRHLASGMAYLSAEGVSGAGCDGPLQILHRDLAARNCLVSRARELKVADFGLSTSGLEAFKLKEKKVPIRWLAPEVLRHNFFSGKSDSWSFGVVLFEIWSDGQRPYDEIKDKRMVKSRVLAGSRLQPPPGTPALFAAVMRACFEAEPARRCTLLQVQAAVRANDPALLGPPPSPAAAAAPPAPSSASSAEASASS